MKEQKPWMQKTRIATMNKALMEELVDAGYPAENFYHHRSDLYIFATPLTKRVVDNWFKKNGYHRHLFVSTFHDQVTGRLMYDIAFQYTPFWEGDRD